MPNNANQPDDLRAADKPFSDWPNLRTERTEAKRLEMSINGLLFTTQEDVEELRATNQAVFKIAVLTTYLEELIEVTIMIQKKQKTPIKNTLTASEFVQKFVVCLPGQGS